MWKYGALVLATAAGIGYAVYSSTGRPLEKTAVELHLRGTASFALPEAHPADHSGTNLLAIQPYMLTEDYASGERFEAKLDGYLAVAKAQGFLSERTVVIWPEYIGTWLAAAEERREVYEAPHLQQAMTTLVLSNLFSFLRWLPFADAQDRLKGALFLMKARRMAALYEQVFGRLAARYRIVLVAGSTVLPDPTVQDGHITIGSGPLYNTSAVFGPDGRLLGPLVRKLFPTKDELPFLRAGKPDDLPVFATPAGKLGVLICADSWYPTPYEKLRQKGAEVIAVPSYLATAGAWQSPWHGYSGSAAPAGVDPADIGRISEAQAWLKYALLGRLRETRARIGVNVFLRGRLWDLGEDGTSYFATPSGPLLGSSESGAQILNLWLGTGP